MDRDGRALQRRVSRSATVTSAAGGERIDCSCVYAMSSSTPRRKIGRNRLDAMLLE
jgi:hypothetical protein